MQTMVSRYARSGGEWVVVVAGQGKALSATASGIVEARTLADQLVQKIVSKSQDYPIIVHLPMTALSQHHFKTRQQAQATIVEWNVNFYNSRRRHSSCDMQSPIDYETITADQAA